MQMKKHIIAAMAAVMILALAAPALAAANVGGNLDFGYTYDIDAGGPDIDTPSNEWGLNVNGNISEDVSFKIGFENDQLVTDQLPVPTEAWIQANDTLLGTVKFGAFDLAFGHGNDAPWYDDDTDPANPIARPLNVQVDNELAGLNISTGVQFDGASGEWNAIGAAVGMEPMENLTAKVGVMSVNGGETTVGYEAAYAGIENLELGLKGNLGSEEMVANAGYEFMPGIKATALYGQATTNVDDIACDSIIEVGAEAAFENGLHAGVAYEMSSNWKDDLGAGDGEDHNVIRVNGGYDYELAEGLTVGLEGNYSKDGDADAQTSFGVTAGIAF